MHPPKNRSTRAYIRCPCCPTNALLPLPAQNSDLAADVRRVAGLEGRHIHERVAAVVKHAQPVAVGIDISVDDRHKRSRLRRVDPLHTRARAIQMAISWSM